MTTTVDDFDFSASEGAAVASESNAGGGGFEREVQFLTLKGDEAAIRQQANMAIVRLVTQYEKKDWMMGPVTKYNFAWITVAQHYARTKNKPEYAREGAQWPEKVYAVCRKDKVFTRSYGGSCYICDTVQNKPSDRTWALGIEREQVIENQQVVGIRDKTREVLVFDDKGQPVVERMDGDKKVYAKKTVPAWVVLNYGWKNFFNGLSGQAQWNRTILDRDYVIQRTGTGANDTNYTFIPLDPIPLGDNPWGVDPSAKYDMGLIVGDDNGRPVPLMEALYPEMPDLRSIIADRTRDDYFGRWFVPGWLPEGFEAKQQQGGSSGYQQGGNGNGYQGFQPQGGYNGQMQGGQQSGVGYTPPQGGSQQPQQPAGGQQSAPSTPQPTQGTQAASGAPAATLEALRGRVLSGTPGTPPPDGQSGQES